MRVTQVLWVVLSAGALLLSACQRASVADKPHPAKLEESGQEGIMRVILEARAAERIGIETTAVTEEQVKVGGSPVLRKVVPYGALMYDTKGDTWTYTNPEPLVFIRHKIVVEEIEGDRVILAEGPAVGTKVVTVGAAELMGAEHKYGH